MIGYLIRFIHAAYGKRQVYVEEMVDAILT